MRGMHTRRPRTHDVWVGFGHVQVHIRVRVLRSVRRLHLFPERRTKLPLQFFGQESGFALIGHLVPRPELWVLLCLPFHALSAHLAVLQPLVAPTLRYTLTLPTCRRWAKFADHVPGDVEIPWSYGQQLRWREAYVQWSFRYCGQTRCQSSGRRMRSSYHFLDLLQSGLAVHVLD